MALSDEWRVAMNRQKKKPLYKWVAFWLSVRLFIWDVTCILRQIGERGRAEVAQG